MGISLNLSCLGICWDSWTCIFISFLNFGKIWAIISLHISPTSFSLFFLRSLQCIYWFAWWHYRSFGICSFIFGFFSFLSIPKQDTFNCVIFKLLILSSSCSNMLLTPLVSFSFQSLYFQLENFYFVPLIMPTFYWYSHFIYIPFSWFLLLCLSMVFFSSLTIIRTVDFTSLTNISNDWAPSGMVSVRYISLWTGYAFYSSLCSVISLFRTGHYEYFMC